MIVHECNDSTYLEFHWNSSNGGDKISGGYPLYPILNVKKKGLWALNILKVIGNTEWGADLKFLLHLYYINL